MFYSVAVLWVNSLDENDPARAVFCGAWLCPLELSGSRSYELQREILSGRADHARAEFERALRLDPASPYAWADFGEATLNSSQRELSTYSFARAVAAAPNSPSILMRAGNGAFILGDARQTMYYMSRVLWNSESAEYHPPVFLTYSRLNVPLSQVLSFGIPQTRWAAGSFLRFLMGRGQVPEAEATWQWILGHSLADDTLPAEYVGFLIDHNEEGRAAETWYALTRTEMPGYRRNNWVFNGSFERAPRPSPLDWRIESTDDVSAMRFEGAAHEGVWSVQLVFAGKENVNYHQLFQQTILYPGKWRAEAFVRTEGLTTDQGLSLHIYDALQPPRLNVSSDNLVGTHDWTRLERLFEVGRRTSLVRIEIGRQPSQKIDNRIAGRAWIDSVKLAPVQ